MCRGRTVSRPLRCGESAVFDDGGGRRDGSHHGDSGHVGGDGGARGFHLYFCLCHQTLCTSVTEGLDEGDDGDGASAAWSRPGQRVCEQA